MTLPLGLAENSIQLVPDGTLILHVLIILVMVYVLNATLFKPINQILAARERRTMAACFGGWSLDAFDIQIYSFTILDRLFHPVQIVGWDKPDELQQIPRATGRNR